MMVKAARTKDAGERNDLEAGMAKYLASEYCAQVVEDSFRIHGGYGYSKEYEIERLYREAPMLLIGEGTADIQKMIIGRRPARGVQGQVTRDPGRVPDVVVRATVSALAAKGSVGRGRRLAEERLEGVPVRRRGRPWPGRCPRSGSATARSRCRPSTGSPSRSAG